MSEARELLKELMPYLGYSGATGSLITRIEAELAKPKPEPFGYVFEYKSGEFLDKFSQSPIRTKNIVCDYDANAVAVYTYPPAQQNSLSDDEVVREIYAALQACHESMAYMSEYDIPITLPDQVADALKKARGEI